MLILGNRFPLIREKLPEPADRMTHDSPQHVVKVFPGVDPASLARLDQAQIQGRSPAAPLTARKHPVLSAQVHRPHGVLGQVVIRPEPSVLKITLKALIH